MTRAKKGISDLIATVLLVLIVIAAIGIIWTAIAPMLKISPKVVECPKFDLSVNTDEGYSWYDKSVLIPGTGARNIQVMVSAGADVIKSDLKDIQIKVRYPGGSETFYVTNTLGVTGAKLTSPTGSAALIGPNEDNVYTLYTNSAIADNQLVSVSVAAIIKPAAGEKTTTCDMSTSVEIPEKAAI